jgi:hypothetical protein
MDNLPYYQKYQVPPPPTHLQSTTKATIYVL